MGNLHKLKIQSTMNVYEDNLDYLINFEDFNNKLKIINLQNILTKLFEQ